MANQVKVKDTTITIGDLVTVYQTVGEKGEEKTTAFDGRVIAIRGRESNKTFMVRKVASNKVGVEKIFPVSLPTIVKVEVKRSLPARRAKLYYLRNQD